VDGQVKIVFLMDALSLGILLFLSEDGELGRGLSALSASSASADFDANSNAL
jgi:hypothetical protein